MTKGKQEIPSKGAIETVEDDKMSGDTSEDEENEEKLQETTDNQL